jgi:mRNA interferase MazF
MPFSPGDVVVVPFPYADMLAEKRRPAVVVSMPQLEKDHSIVWLAMVTSTEQRRQGDVPVTDLAAVGLTAACFVRPAKIATASVSRIVRKAGALSAPDWQAVRAVLERYSASSSRAPRATRDPKRRRPARS